MDDGSTEHFSFRWGIPLFDDGHTTVPNLFFRRYAELGITRTEFLFILHLASYKYDSPQGESRPSLQTIAREMGYSDARSVQRLRASLEEKGLLAVRFREGRPSIYDFRVLSQRMILGYDIESPPTNLSPPPPTELSGVPLTNLSPKEKKIRTKQQESTPSAQTSRPETRRDYLDDCVSTFQASGGLSYTVTPEGGGRDPYADGPLAAACGVCGVTPDVLTKKTRKNWARGLRQIAEEWHATPTELTDALLMLKQEGSGFEFKSYSSPYQHSFSSDVGIMIGRIRCTTFLGDELEGADLSEAPKVVYGLDAVPEWIGGDGEPI